MRPRGRCSTPMRSISSPRTNRFRLPSASAHRRVGEPCSPPTRWRRRGCSSSARRRKFRPTGSMRPKQLASRFAATVVLKGSGSVVASPGRRPGINSTGSSALATAGSGDVLAGWMGGLWAQSPGIATHELARTAVAWHGAAAQGHAGPLLATDLIEAMATLHAASR
ncbi:carbohydrate kinase domain-containing protein [Ditylenchus destructor]|nr:carbohydrate kinase domain-containing protein [Ditylenchus destructor]